MTDQILINNHCVTRFRIFSLLCAVVALTSSALAYQEQQFIGFPDGYVSQIDGAEQTLLRIFALFSFLFGCSFARFAWSARGRAMKKLLIVISFYALTTAMLFAIFLYMQTQLDNGIG